MVCLALQHQKKYHIYGVPSTTPWEDGEYSRQAVLLDNIMNSNPLEVLIADDEWMIRKAVSRYLDRAGFDVASAGDTSALLSAIQQRHPRILFIDYHMPSMDVYSIIKNFHSIVPDSIVIIMTGDATVDLSGIEEEVHAVLQKPFTMEELLSLVSALLNRE